MKKAELDRYIGITGFHLTKTQRWICRLKAGLFGNELAVSLAKLYHSRNNWENKKEIYN